MSEFEHPPLTLAEQINLVFEPGQTEGIEAKQRLANSFGIPSAGIFERPAK